ncbi:MAG: hypothetical protein Q9180_007520, partial [Flavoplaca navasiana]
SSISTPSILPGKNARDNPSLEEITSALQVQCNKAAALLICWADGSNHHAEYDRHIMQLRSTFEDSFGFPTTVSYLDPLKLLELQVLSKVSEFAAAHDGRDDLLVVYYAGFVDVGDYCSKKELNRDTPRDEIVWLESEKVLRMTVSHVLWIFDGSFFLYFVGRIETEVGQSHVFVSEQPVLTVRFSVFEQLYTWLHPSWKRGLVKVPKAPPRSITPALIMALQEVAKHANDGNVCTTKDLFNIMRAELIVSRPGCYAKIQLRNAQCDTTLDDHIVL